MKRNTIEYVCGNVLRELRIKAGYAKIETLAVEMNVSISKLSKIETGYQLLDIATLHKFCMTLDLCMGSVVRLMQNDIVNIIPLPQLKEKSKSK